MERLDHLIRCRHNARRSLIVHYEHIQRLVELKKEVLAEWTRVSKRLEVLAKELSDIEARLETAIGNHKDRARMYEMAGLVDRKDLKLFGGFK